MFFWTKKRPFPDILLPATYRAIIVMSLRRWERFLSKMMSHINSFLTLLTPAQLSVWRNVRLGSRVVSLGLAIASNLLLPLSPRHQLRHGTSLQQRPLSPCKPKPLFAQR